MRALLGAALLTVGLAGCSALVEPWGQPLKCAPEVADACPEGQRCVDGVCQRAESGCEPSGRELCGNNRDDDCDGEIDEGVPETCNGLDDDCDGEIDEDEAQDEDGDGFTWCGSGKKSAVDCNDREARANPGQPETCDGLDNDCDGAIDEHPETLCAPGLECVGNTCMAPRCSPGSCPDGERCDQESGRCIDAACTPGKCPEGTTCDSLSGECTRTRRANGEECLLDTDCTSGLCADALALRMRQLGDRVCIQACCSDADCPQGQLCYASGSGTRSCLPEALDPRTAPLPACTQDAQCGPGAVCGRVGGQRVSTVFGPERDELILPACYDPGFGALPAGESCASFGDRCASDLCAVRPGSLFTPSLYFCTSICRNSADCEPIEQAVGGGTHIYCRYQATVASATEDDDYLPVCIASRGETGPGAPGASCARDSDCADAACVGAPDGYCAPPCCSDAQCAALPGTRCRPRVFADRHEMRCLP